ncbi:hypothetical protein QRD89_05490 [Halobacillus sp. ACCC02827]|uniref:hypothetical protein n=1 Tax=Halobacillus sp. ACCC02827 TaxID=3052090 RepID=UPI0025702B1B|nr:hypothetical protein [Halobacillus sp. ACCC02827]WJE16802.1 hypothetical protein QRD89_05490 [Halobacillus sp. ACCC02827]
MAELHDLLMDAKKKMYEKDQLERKREKRIAEAEALRLKEEALRHKLQEEEEDVEKLEKMSLMNLFVTVSGRKLERMEKEKREVVEARLKWREVKQAVKEIQREISGMEAAISALGNPEREYDRCYQEKKANLIKKGSQKGRKIIELGNQRSFLQAELVEIEEAVTAGKQAGSALDEAATSLSSAENWGVLDMVGGGFWTTAVKHSELDDADRYIRTAQQYLRTFANELDDLHDHYEVKLEVSSGWAAADYFFDSLVVDWFVQNKIQASQKEVEDLRSRTYAAVAELESLHQQYEQQEAELKREQDQVIGA